MVRNLVSPKINSYMVFTDSCHKQ